MFRRVLVLVLVLSAVPAIGARAQQADSSRWSLGAGLLSDRGEAFIGHRIAPKLEALFLVRVGLHTGGASSQGDWGFTGPPAYTRSPDESFDVGLGAGLRRSSRAGEGLRSYGSVLVTAGMNGQEMTISALTDLQYRTRTFDLGLEAALGAEYVSPWSLSLAVDATLASVNWNHTRTTMNQPPATGPEPIYTSWGLTFKSSLSPRVLVRAYF